MRTTTLEKLQSSIEKTKWDLSNTLNQEHLSYMQKIHNSTYQKELAKAKEHQLKKFPKLHVKKLTQQAETCNSTDKSKWVINLSSHDINKDEKELLEKGLNYSITHTTIPAVELVAKKQAPKPNCTRNQIAALKFWQQNDNIIILPADKGRATVILNKEDHIRKCNEHLENGPYIKIKKDPPGSVVSQITRKLSVLRDNKSIDQQHYLKLKPTGSQPTPFYGVPKIHKDEIPVCLIVSYTGTPLYEVSKHIAEILKPYGKQKEQHTNNSKSFSTFIRQQTIEPDKIMVSFDVTSLCTTIPIDQALLIIEDLLQHEDKLADRTPLTPNQILDLLSILLRTTYFKFNDQFYQ